jgi:hypothetical protein
MKLTAGETDMLEQSSRTITRMTRRTALPLLCLHALTHFAAAQSVLTFAGNAQHTAIYEPAARNLNRIPGSLRAEGKKRAKSQELTIAGIDPQDAIYGDNIRVVDAKNVHSLLLSETRGEPHSPAPRHPAIKPRLTNI